MKKGEGRVRLGRRSRTEKGLETFVIRVSNPYLRQQLRILGIVGFPIPKYDAQTGTWQMQKQPASG